MAASGSPRRRLARLGVLAPAALSACANASVLVVPAGAIVSTLLRELSRAFMLKKWFHGALSAQEAERLMMERGRNGSFLVRESRGSPGDYVLSVRVRGRVSHVVIRKQDNKYEVGSGERQFDELAELIEHYRSYPMVESSGDVLRLLQPLSFTRVRLVDLQSKKDVLEDEMSRDKLEREFEALRALDSLHHFTCYEGTRPENSCKNRYRNIVPYDQSRVILRGKQSDEPRPDYINASYIRVVGEGIGSVQSSTESLCSLNTPKVDLKKSPLLVTKSLTDDTLIDLKHSMRMDKLNGNSSAGPVGDKLYIATQGCLPNTEEDFWHMIWQEDVRIIAMITNEIEKGKRKCEAYWPAAVGDEKVYAGCSVRLVSERRRGDGVRRELALTDSREPAIRTVYQFQLLTWPDHGTPVQTRAVIAFLRDVNERLALVLKSATDRPEHAVVCVHCSAGVGRTGTFIVLDSIIDQIKRKGMDGSIDILRTAKAVRSQRAGAVQNFQQYKFIYRAAHDYVATCNNFDEKILASEV